MELTIILLSHFSNEPVARVKGQLRRYKKYNLSDKEDVKSYILTSSGLELNIKTRECHLNGKSFSLTPSEFNILRILLEHKGGGREFWGTLSFSMER